MRLCHDSHHCFSPFLMPQEVLSAACASAPRRTSLVEYEPEDRTDIDDGASANNDGEWCPNIVV